MLTLICIEFLVLGSGDYLICSFEEEITQINYYASARNDLSVHGLITSFVVFGKKSRRSITMLQPGMIYLCMLVRAGGNHTVYNHYASASIYACVHGIVWQLICQCFKIMVGLRYLLLWGNNWLWPSAISDGSLSLEAYYIFCQTKMFSLDKICPKKLLCLFGWFPVLAIGVLYIHAYFNPGLSLYLWHHYLCCL